MYKVTDGDGKEHKLNEFEIELKHDKEGKPKGEKLISGKEVLYDGNKPCGVKKMRE